MYVCMCVCIYIYIYIYILRPAARVLLVVHEPGHYGQVVVVQVVIAKLCFSHFLATSLWSQKAPKTALWL